MVRLMNTTNRPNPGELDYWDFVELTKGRLNDRLAGTDVEASHLALSLNRASETMKQVSESTVHRPLKLTWSSFQVLFVLWIAGEIDQARLTDLTHHSKATVSNLAANLLKLGLVERRSSEADRRTFRLRLTPEGEKTVSAAYMAQNELFVQWSSVLDEAERETLVALLNKLMRRRDVFGARGVR